MDTWRLIIDPPSPAGYNMAVDEVLADACRRGLIGPTLRLYEWDRPSISLGYFQRAEAVVDLDQCRAAGVPVVRRTTGGRAVVHHRELTYSLVAPVPHPDFPPSIRGAYDVVARAISVGLAGIGIPVEVHAREPRRSRHGVGSPFCFDAISRSEITLHGRKVIGSAQRRWPTAFLQHGSLIVAPAPDKASEWFCSPPTDVPSISGLSAMGRDLAMNDLREAIRLGFERTVNARLQVGTLSPDEESAVAHAGHSRDLAAHATSVGSIRESGVDLRTRSR